MHVAFLVNGIEDLSPTRATTRLLHGAAQRGLAVVVGGVQDLSLRPDGRVVLHGRTVVPQDDDAASVTAIQLAAPAAVPLGLGDVLMMRTNPPRDPGREPWHAAALDLARIARDEGVVVLNGPDVLARASSKLDLVGLPARLRPATALCSGRGELSRLLDQWGGRAVLKPLRGTRGSGVMRVAKTPGDGWSSLADAMPILSHGPLLAQSYIPEAPDGDVRILILEGRVLRVDGVAAAVRRKPQNGEWRSNVHLGGVAAPANWTPELARVADDTARELRGQGVFFAGIDVVGSRVVEVNVFSPGGLGNIEASTGRDFTRCVLDAMQARMQRSLQQNRR